VSLPMPDISATTSPPPQHSSDVSFNDEPSELIRSHSTTVTNRSKISITPNESAYAEFEDKNRTIDPLPTESVIADVNGALDQVLECNGEEGSTKAPPPAPKPIFDQVLDLEAGSTEVTLPALKPSLRPRPNTPSLNSCRPNLILRSGTDTVREALRLLFPTCTVSNVDIILQCLTLNDSLDSLRWNYMLVLPSSESAVVWASPRPSKTDTRQRGFIMSVQVDKNVLEIVDFLAPREHSVASPKGLLRDAPLEKWHQHRTTDHCTRGQTYIGHDELSPGEEDNDLIIVFYNPNAVDGENYKERQVLLNNIQYNPPCYICNEVEHFKKDCPHRYSATQFCNYCGNVDHHIDRTTGQLKYFRQWARVLSLNASIISETDSPQTSVQDLLSTEVNTSCGSLEDQDTSETSPTIDEQPTINSPTADKSVSTPDTEHNAEKRMEDKTSTPVLKPKKVTLNNQVYYSEDAVASNSENTDKITSVSLDSSSSHNTGVYKHSSQKTNEDASLNHNSHKDAILTQNVDVLSCKYLNHLLTLPPCTNVSPFTDRMFQKGETTGDVRVLQDKEMDRIHSIPSGMVRQILEEAVQSSSDMNCQHQFDSNLFEEVKERLAYLEALDDSENKLPQAEITTHSFDALRILEFIVLDIAGFDTIIGMDPLDNFNPDASLNRHILRFRDLIHCSTHKSPAQNKLDTELNPIMVSDPSSTDSKSSANSVTLKLKDQPFLPQYPSIARSTPVYLAVIVQCEEGETAIADMSFTITTEVPRILKYPDKPESLTAFVDNSSLEDIDTTQHISEHESRGGRILKVFFLYFLHHPSTL